MLTKSVVFAALACSQVFALPALAPRQASEASSALASLTEAATSVVESATSSAADAASSVSESAASATGSASSAAESASSEASSAVESASSEASASATSSSAAPSASPSDYASGLLAAIRARGATGLASLIAGNDQIAQAVVGLLGQESQNFTLIAPSNSGLEEATQNIDTNDTAAVQELLTYHVLPGYYPADYFEVNQTVILNTALNQNLVFYRDQFETTQIVGGQNVTILGNSTYNNVLIKLADNALQTPQNVSATLADSEYGTSLVNTISSTAPDLVQQLDTAPAITVFAPSNQALSNIQDQLAQLAGDQAQLQQILLGHVITGQTLYSNAGPNNLETQGSTAQSAAGTTLNFIKNGTGLYVESQGTTAQITEANIITSNGEGQSGVIHVIDSVLVPAQPAGGAAGGASDSASSAAESATSEASSAASSASGAVESATSSAAEAASSGASAASDAAASVTEGAASAAQSASAIAASATPSA